MSHAVFAYTASFVFAVTVAAGALLFVMIAHTARARWFVLFRRCAEAIAAPMPLFLVLFLPIALGVRTLYPWARPIEPGSDPELARMLAHQQVWMNPPLFIARAYVCLGAWTLLALALRRDSIASDEGGGEAHARRERLLSAVGLPVMAVTLTVAAFDWVMPLSPSWASDMLGVYLFAGSLAGAVAAIAVAAWLARRAGVLPDAVKADHFHALGRVMLVGVIFWGYIAFAQFLLVWIADIPREALFFGARVRRGWAAVSAILLFAHFVVPFLLLLSRSLKRRPAPLAAVGAWLLGAHALDVYWLCVPPAGDGPRGLDGAWMIGLAAACAAFGAWRFAAVRPVPVHDPELGEALRYESP